MSIPIISPIELQLGEPGVRRLPAPPDYEVDALPPAAVLTADEQKVATDPAMTALDEMAHATRISEYHDSSWWEERIQVIRAQLEQHGGEPD